MNDSECILKGDTSCDWLTGTPDCFKEVCDSLNLVQLINEPTIEPTK